MPSAAHQPSAEFGRRPPCRPDGARVGDRGSTGGWAVEQGDRARAWDQLPHGRGPPRSDYGQDPGSPLFGAGALGSWCGSPAWDGPRRLICGLAGQANLSSDAARNFQVYPSVSPKILRIVLAERSIYLAVRCCQKGNGAFVAQGWRGG